MILIPFNCIKLPDISNKDGGNKTDKNFPYVPCYQFNSTEEEMRDVRYKFEIYEYTAAWILLLWSLMYTLSEVISGLSRRKNQSWSKLGILNDAIQIFLAFMISIKPCLHSLGIFENSSPSDIFVYCSAVKTDFQLLIFNTIFFYWKITKLQEFFMRFFRLE